MGVRGQMKKWSKSNKYRVISINIVKNIEILIENGIEEFSIPYSSIPRVENLHLSTTSDHMYLVEKFRKGGWQEYRLAGDRSS